MHWEEEMMMLKMENNRLKKKIAKVEKEIEMKNRIVKEIQKVYGDDFPRNLAELNVLAIKKLEAENKKLKERIAELEKKQLPEPQDAIPLDQRIRESAD